jgi:hypothetical protein
MAYPYFRTPVDGSSGWYHAGSGVGVDVGVCVGVAVTVDVADGVEVDVGVGVGTAVDWQADVKEERKIAIMRICPMDE